MGDLQDGACKTCKEKPRKVELCVRTYFQADCHPDKKGDKPVSCCGKTHNVPREDRARLVAECQSCGGWADFQSEVAHKEDCKSRLNVKRFCLKSGTPPHAEEAR